MIDTSCSCCGYKHGSAFKVSFDNLVIFEDSFGNLKFGNDINYKFSCLKCGTPVDFKNDARFERELSYIQQFIVGTGTKDFKNETKDIDKLKDEELNLAFRLDYSCLAATYSNFVNWKVQCAIILNEIKKRGLEYEDKYNLFNKE